MPRQDSLFDAPLLRISAFVLLCMGARAALAGVASCCMETPLVRTALLFFASVAAVGWLRLWIFGLRMHAVEAGGSGTWWNDLRPIHAALYLCFVAFGASDTRRRDAWRFLAADAVVAAAAWVWHRRYTAR